MKNEVTTLPLQGEESLLKSAKKVIQAPKKLIQPEYIYYKSEHLYTYKNSLFGEAFLSCLLERNVLQKLAINSRYLHEENGQTFCIATNEARYKSWYKVLNVSTITGEIEAIIKESDSLIRQRGKIINTLKMFDKTYKLPYRQKKVSCMFGTLTNVPNAKFTMRIFMKHLRTIFKRKGINLLSYVWISEVKFNYYAKDKQLPVHWHYHFVLAIERIEVTGGKLPECLSNSYLTELWGQRAEVKFISGGNACLNYCSKYISKNGTSTNGVILGVRRSGASRNITSKIASLKQNIKQNANIINT